MLHITNGGSVVMTMHSAQLPGEYLAWNDVLHDGPVPGGLSLSELSDVRARMLAEDPDEYPVVRDDIARRDAKLADFRQHDEVILWFEHDLYDQLQLIQLLDWFSRQEPGSTKLSIIQIGSHPEVTPFFGLGQLTAKQLGALFPLRQPVSDEQLAEGKEAWSAFTAADPTALPALAARTSLSMPFLSRALMRFLQEYPWTSDGLSRNERQILRAAAQHTDKWVIYHAASREEAVPWGDSSVFRRMEGLSEGAYPALQASGHKDYLLTEHGKRLLASHADWIEVCGGIDLWLGGVHLHGKKAQWRWDDAAKKLRHG